MSSFLVCGKRWKRLLWRAAKARFHTEITARPLAATKREHGVPPLTG
jgi:hypothetical protein